MQKFIARENIKRFRRLLQTVSTENDREVLLKLLKSEEEKLAKLQARGSDLDRPLPD